MSLTDELLLFVLTPRLGKALAQLHTHRVQTLQDPLLPLALIGVEHNIYLMLSNNDFLNSSLALIDKRQKSTKKSL